MGFEEIFVSMSAQDMIIFFLICFALIIPFLYFASVFKKRLKVGKIDTSGTAFVLILFYVIINFTGAIPDLFLFFYVVFICGFIAFGIIFNRMAGDAKKTYIRKIDVKNRRLYEEEVYTYEDGDETCIIRLGENEYVESFWNKLKRFRGKPEILKVVGDYHLWKANKNTPIYYCLDKITRTEPYHFKTEKVKLPITYLNPIATGKYSEVVFIAKFRGFMRLKKEIQALIEHITELETDMPFLVKKEVRKVIAKIETQLGFTELTELFNRYWKINFNVPYETDDEKQKKKIFQKSDSEESNDNQNRSLEVSENELLALTEEIESRLEKKVKGKI